MRGGFADGYLPETGRDSGQSMANESPAPRQVSFSIAKYDSWYGQGVPLNRAELSPIERFDFM
jgi:hypothetical protein